jgi:hypothetical protein
VRTGPECRIVMHTYDYAPPTGKGLFGDSSWLLAALVNARVPPDLRDACIGHLIDQFHETLGRIARTDPATLYLVDSRGILAPGDWHNELHPTREGFRKIAVDAWEPVLAGAGLVHRA